MLDRTIAQKIVNKMMEVVPYNINIMDDEAVIIGSGETDRIGTLHYGAAEALTRKGEVIIYKEDEFVKKGANIPILFKNEIVGVIGITGDSEEVCNFTKLIKVTAELLLTEQYSLRDALMRQRVKEEFLYEWIYTRNGYKGDMALRGKSLNIDILKDRIALVLYSKEIKKFEKRVKSMLFIGEYTVPISSDKIAVILNYEDGYINRIERMGVRFAKYNIVIGVGGFYKIINESFGQAIQSVLIGRKIFNDKRVIYYKDIEFFCNGIASANKKILNNIKLKIEEYKGGEELLDTLMKYIELNGEKSKISEELHIHRNTLNYRLNSIEKITGLNLNSYIDMYILITLYLMVKIKE